MIINFKKMLHSITNTFKIHNPRRTFKNVEKVER